MSCAVCGDSGRVHHGDRDLATCGPSGHDVARTADRFLESTRPRATGDPPVGISCLHLGPDVDTARFPATGQRFSGRDLQLAVLAPFAVRPTLSAHRASTTTATLKAQ